MSSTSPPKSQDNLESSSLYSPQRLQYSLPQNERPPRQDFSNRYRPRRGSTASFASSIGGTLDTATHSTVGPLHDLTHNAIATLLSPPIVRTGLLPQGALGPTAQRPPSIRDIPPVTLTTIPHVDPATFKPYLAQIGSLYGAYQRAKAAQDESGSQSSRNEKDSANGDYFSQLLGRKLRSDSISSKTSKSPTSSGELSPPPPSPRKRSSSLDAVRRSVYAPTPLSTIPSVYFDDNFQLENPRVFDVVSEYAEVSPTPLPESRDESTVNNGSLKGRSTGRRALHTNAILQEKLSWYMDTVEVHLISSIATASSSFFTALGSLKELQSEAADSTTRIQSLRSALKSLDIEMATGGLEVMKMQRRRENMHKLGAAVSQLGEVIEEAQKCEALVDQGDLEGADERIEGLGNIIVGRPFTSSSDGHHSQRIDLRQLRALDGIADGIDQLRFRIGRGFETRFVEALLRDLRQHVESVPPEDTMQRWAKTSLRLRGENNRPKSELPAYLKTNEHLRPDLLSSLAGLNKTNHKTHAATAYREAVMREIKSLIRRNLPSSNDDDAESVTSMSTRGGRRLNQQEKSAILARNLRSLDPNAAEELLVKVYTSVGEALRRLGVQTKVLLDVTSSIEQPSNDRIPKSPPRTAVLESIDRRMTQDSGTNGNHIQDEMTQALDLSSLLGQAVDVVQIQVSKVLKVRGEQSARLPLQQFLRYFTLNRLFADECEAVSSRSGDALKDVINYQVKEFLSIMSESERQHINQVLEADCWEAKDFGPAEVVVLERILESMNSTPKAWAGYTQLWNDSIAENIVNGTTSDSSALINGNGNIATPRAQEKPQVRPAIIDTQPYILTASSIDLLHGLDAFLNLIAAMPFLASDAGPRLLDYLKTFNSRCCQLILGAGATKSAGLKNITTKHLALASQACSFIVALVPYMREFVRRQGERGVAGPLLAEFDRVKRMVQEHQGSIHEKLVDIMTQRSHAHVNAMKKVDWDAGGDAEAALPTSAFAEALTKETGTLHRVLSRHVSEIDLRMIMIPIFKHYNQEWTKAFREAVVRTEMGKARMLRDVEYLDSKLSKVEGGSDFGKELLTLVKEKQVAAIPAAQSIATVESKVTSSVAPKGRSSVEIMGAARASIENEEKNA